MLYSAHLLIFMINIVNINRYLTASADTLKQRALQNMKLLLANTQIQTMLIL